jgi:hypothetical protein
MPAAAPGSCHTRAFQRRHGFLRSMEVGLFLRTGWVAEERIGRQFLPAAPPSPNPSKGCASETTGSARQRLRPEVSVSNGARLSSRNAVRAAIRGLLADAELREQGVQDVLDPDVAGNPADFTHCEAKVLPTQFRQNSLFRDLQVFSR